jgi:hypothetical protein
LIEKGRAGRFPASCGRNGNGGGKKKQRNKETKKQKKQKKKKGKPNAESNHGSHYYVAQTKDVVR